MGRPRNIFYQLINDENHHSDLLCNMLYFDATRSVLENMLGMSPIKPERIETRITTDGTGNPDIVYQDEDKAFLIEVKTTVWRTLTDHQPISYLEYLSNMRSKTKKLFFLIPIGYPHLREINDRLEKAGRPDTDVTFLYWEDIYSTLRKRTDLHYVEEQFLDCIRDDFEYGEVSMTEDEKNLLVRNDIWVVLDKVRKIINNVYMELKKENQIAVTEVINEEGDDYGFYIIDKNNKIAFWAGMWEPVARKTGCALTLSAYPEHRCFQYFQDELPEKAPGRYKILSETSSDSTVEASFLTLIKNMYGNIGK